MRRTRLSTQNGSMGNDEQRYLLARAVKRSAAMEMRLTSPLTVGKGGEGSSYATYPRQMASTPFEAVWTKASG